MGMYIFVRLDNAKKKPLSKENFILLSKYLFIEIRMGGFFKTDQARYLKHFNAFLLFYFILFIYLLIKIIYLFIKIKSNDHINNFFRM